MILAAVCAGAVAFVLAPDFGIPAAAISVALFRGALTGAVVGLTLDSDVEMWYPGVIALASALLGTVLVRALGAELGGETVLAIAIAVAATYVQWWLARAVDQKAAVALGLALVLALAVYGSGFAGGAVARAYDADRRAELSSQPVPDQYQFDGMLFLRIRDLMKQGTPFYPAFRQAVIDDARLDEATLTSPFNFREPFLFYVWKLLPGPLPYHLLLWFFGFTLVAAGCSYATAIRLTGPGPALLAPFAMVVFCSFFLWVDTWFTMTEVWVGLLGVAALMALVRGWRVASLVLLVAAVATREYTLLFVPAWLVAWWFSTSAEERRSTWWFPLTAVVGPIAVLAYHVLAAPTTGSGGLDLAQWLDGGTDRLIAALRFGWDALPDTKILPLAITLMAVIGSAIARPAWVRYALVVLVGVQLLFLLIVSKNEWSYYWGAYFTPLVIALMPSVFGRAVPPAHLVSGDGSLRSS